MINAGAMGALPGSLNVSVFPAGLVTVSVLSAPLTACVLLSWPVCLCVDDNGKLDVVVDDGRLDVVEDDEGTDCDNVCGDDLVSIGKDLRGDLAVGDVGEAENNTVRIIKIYSYRNVHLLLSIFVSYFIIKFDINLV